MLTPENRTFAPFLHPATIDDCWIDTNYPFLQPNDFSIGIKEQLIIAACAQINEMCNRYFNEQEADQVFVNKKVGNGYVMFSLRNRPVATITDVFLQVGSQFVELNSDYFQFSPQTGVFKIFPYPEASVSITTFLPYLPKDELNTWIRYTSGFSSVPENVKMATALMYNYNISTYNNPSGATEFKTQTYSERLAGTPTNNPTLTQIKLLLSTYLIPTVV